MTEKLQITFSKEALETIEYLKVVMGMENGAEVIKGCLQLTKIIVSKRLKGAKVLFRNQDGSNEEFCVTLKSE